MKLVRGFFAGALGWLLVAGGCVGTAGDVTGSGGGPSGGGSGGRPSGGGSGGASGVAGSSGAGGTGGAAGTGGATGTGTGGATGVGGRSGTGGATGTGGLSGAAGAGAGGATTGACSGAAADPVAASTISGYMDKLPYGPPKKQNDPPQPGDARYPLIDAIIKSCAEFGPPSSVDAGWQQQYCWAHLTAAIDKESSYNATSVVADTYSTRTVGTETAADPTIGLLQIRFSSTVHDYAVQGPPASLACVGCTFPANFADHKNDSGGGNSDFWAVSGPTPNLALMQSVPCNVGLGAWYYYTYATGNGNASQVTYLAQYCQGKGTAANLTTGLRSHLEGPDGAKGVIADIDALTALMSSDSNAYNYITQIKSWFDSMVGTVSGTHPFFITLVPNPSQYCAD
jgi:hypothetical protein